MSHKMCCLVSLFDCLLIASSGAFTAPIDVSSISLDLKCSVSCGSSGGVVIECT